MVAPEKSFTSNPYLTGQNQLQIAYNPIYPNISDSQWGIDSVSITFLVGIDHYDLSAGWQKAYSRYNLHSGFKRGSFYFREKTWTSAEMTKVLYEVAERAIYYYFSKYGEDFFKQDKTKG